MKLDKKKVYIAMVKTDIMTQKELAKRSGIGVSTMAMCINGKNVGLPTLSKIAKALKCNPFEILQDE